MGTPHEVIGAAGEREGSVAKVGTVGIWVTSSCNLLVFRACSGLISYIQLPFDGVLLSKHNFMAWCDRQQLLHVGSSGFMVTWWPMVKCSVSAKAQ